MFLTRAFRAGEPLWNTPDSGTGDGASGDDGAGNKPSEGKDQFDKGYGKGVAKGQKEMLEKLGVKSVDDLTAALEKAAAADEAARKTAEEQGKFEELYKAEQAKTTELTKERDELQARFTAIEEAQKTELAGLTEKLADGDKALLEGLPLDRALAMAKRLTGAAQEPVGAGPAGNGGTPDKSGGKDLAWYEKKGYANLTPEERAEADRLLAERDSMSIAELRRRHQMGGMQ